MGFYFQRVWSWGSVTTNFTPIPLVTHAQEPHNSHIEVTIFFLLKTPKPSKEITHLCQGVVKATCSVVKEANLEVKDLH